MILRGPVAQSAEASDLRSDKCEFESRQGPPYAAVENWHIILTQNQAFVGSSPTCGTRDVPSLWVFMTKDLL